MLGALCRLALFAVIATTAAGCALLSQHGLAVYAPLVARADSLAVAGDTASALAALDSAVRREPRNAVAWYRRGMLSWAQGRPSRRLVGPMSQQNIDLLRAADTSLRKAHRLAPDSGRYALDLGRYFLYADVITLRLQAPRKLGQALEAARRAGDSALVAEAADELGMVHWRRYEAMADRRRLKNVAFAQLDRLVSDQRAARTFLEQFTEPIEPPLGEKAYQAALEHFNAALAADSTNGRALRHLFMALAEKRDWVALERAADRRLEAASYDPLAWLGRGLARQRLNDGAAATVAFDSALALMSATDRSRFTRLSRILRAKDSASYEGMSAADKGRLEQTYWLVADPLALTPGNEYWLEFLARVAFAELRWSSTDFDLHGADTDRGQIYVRHGPPPVVASFAPTTEETQECEADPRGYGRADMLPGYVCTTQTVGLGVGLILWYYPDLNLHFVFRAPPTWGTAAFAGDYATIAAEARQVAPATWTNLPIARRAIDSIPVQLARFRAPDDSADVLVFADVPIRSLVRGLTDSAVAIDVAFSAYDFRGRLIVLDSSRQVVDPARPDAAERRSWRRRFGAGTLIYRVEALQPDSLRAARALGETQLRPVWGFGVSDLVVAERVQPRGNRGERWWDFLIVPSVGVFARGQPVGLLWETYGLTAREGASRYRVTLSLEPVEKGGPASMAVRVLSGVRSALGLSAQGEGSLTLSYTREVAAGAAIPDHVTLDLSGVPTGRYRMRVEQTDLFANQTAANERVIRILR